MKRDTILVVENDVKDCRLMERALVDASVGERCEAVSSEAVA